MADITMCQDSGCPHRDSCYRKLAKANPRGQSFFMKSPREDDWCSFYWPVSDTINRNHKESRAYETETK